MSENIDANQLTKLPNQSKSRYRRSKTGGKII